MSGYVRSVPSRQMSLVRSRANFPGGCNFWTPLTAYCGFFREENITVLEARSILYAVWYAESNHPPGRLLILSENLALVLALCKECSTNFALLSVMRRIFASGFVTSFVLTYTTGEDATLTVMMTRANHFFMFLHSAYHDLHWYVFSYSRINRPMNCIVTILTTSCILKPCCLVIGPSSPFQSCWPQDATSVETRCCEMEFCAPRFVHTRGAGSHVLMWSSVCKSHTFSLLCSQPSFFWSDFLVRRTGLIMRACVTSRSRAKASHMLSTDKRPRLFLSLSLMHVVDDGVDLASYVRVPAMSVQSHVPSDVLSN